MMNRDGHIIQTPRLILRPWLPSDLDAFSNMHRDADVMADMGGPLTDARCAAKLQRYLSAFRNDGYSRWCVTDRDQRFVGYVGINHHADHPHLGKHDEIGWRLNKTFWGQGLATEAAKAALDDGFDRLQLPCVFSCASPTNIRSQSVMQRLGLARSAEFDFIWKDDDGSELPVLVWRADRNTLRA